MVKHVILWKLKEMTESEKSERIAAIKEHLEGLQGQIDGLLSIRVETQSLTSSNVDLMLDTSFTDEAALKGYSVHPAHVAVANTYVRPFTAERKCFDYSI